MKPELQLSRVPYDDEDVQRLTALAQEYYTSLYGNGDEGPIDTTQFEDPHGEFWLGRLGDEPVVIGGWRFIDDGPPETAGMRTVELKRMFSAPSRRRLGLGRWMLNHLVARARSAGAEWVVLESGRPQTAGIALYESAGFVPVTAFGHYAWSDLSVHMGLRLPQE